MRVVLGSIRTETRRGSSSSAGASVLGDVDGRPRVSGGLRARALALGLAPVEKNSRGRRGRAVVVESVGAVGGDEWRRTGGGVVVRCHAFGKHSLRKSSIGAPEALPDEQGDVTTSG